MEAARAAASGHDFLLVTAERQTQGRGTKGRAWQSPQGNIYLTAAVHRNFLPPERMRLFPLEAGLALWETAASFLPPAQRNGLRLKWPNDLLWNQRKVAGMLMESTGDYLLIGAGINIGLAPEVSDGGTASAALIEAGADPECGLPLAKDFFEHLRKALTLALRQTLLEEWKLKALWEVPLRLRDRPGQSAVLPVDINSEGHLRVRFNDGHEEWLVSEYLT
jgi:biotin-[acetyl-CoA-carboxylase] ligase BirA-like protein